MDHCKIRQLQQDYVVREAHQLIKNYYQNMILLKKKKKKLKTWLHVDLVLKSAKEVGLGSHKKKPNSLIQISSRI
jgi:hypothetical protein